MSGAQPKYLAASFILEEGFPFADLKRIVSAMSEAANQAKVPIVTGDTKVVERGKGDGVFITTTGVGVVPDGIHLSANQSRPGDKIVLSGSIADHGAAILSQRQGLGCSTPIQSDTAALHELVGLMVREVPGIRCLRDPTRGGLAAVLNELAQQSGVGMRIIEDAIPIKEQVHGLCELLGLDPLFVANEGKLVAICPADSVRRLVEVMRSHPLGAQAACIGEVVEDPQHFVEMRTAFGGRRMVDWMAGEPLPRIC
jgi:hydrogenase expression/formation protein HypE